jgi:hypothetical protein
MTSAATNQKPILQDRQDLFFADLRAQTLELLQMPGQLRGDLSPKQLKLEEAFREENACDRAMKFLFDGLQASPFGRTHKAYSELLRYKMSGDKLRTRQEVRDFLAKFISRPQIPGKASSDGQKKQTVR